MFPGIALYEALVASGMPEDLAALTAADAINEMLAG